MMPVDVWSYPACWFFIFFLDLGGLCSFKISSIKTLHHKVIYRQLHSPAVQTFSLQGAANRKQKKLKGKELKEPASDKGLTEYRPNTC